MDSIVSRSIFHHNDHSDDSSSSSKVCPALPTPLDDADKVVGEFTIHQFLLVFGAAGAGVAIITSMILFFLHAFNIRNPQEQIKIMRIITIIPVFCIIGLANIFLGQASIYLEPWGDVYEGICLCTFYMLVHTYISPTLAGQAEYFSRLPYKKKPNGPATGSDSIAFWRKSQLLTFQIIPVTVIVAIAIDIAQSVGTYCINSIEPHFAHIWISIISFTFTGLAVYIVIRFTYRLKPEMPDRNIATQLWAFKLIIGLNAFQTFVFSIAAGKITPTNTLSYNDIAIGLPNLLLIIEMVGFSIFFHKAYSWGRYSAHGPDAIRADGSRQQKVVMNPFVAIFKALNPIEVFVALFQVITGRWKASAARPASPSNMELLQQTASENDPKYYQQQQHWHDHGHESQPLQGWPQPTPAWNQQEYGYQQEYGHTSYGNGPNGPPQSHRPYEQEYERR